MDSKHLDSVTADRWAKQNGLLGRLSYEAFHRLVPLLTPATLQALEILYKPEQQISDIYFPDTAVLCAADVETEVESCSAS